MSTRADQYTQLKQTPISYSDFFDGFFAHPITGDVSKTTNDASIKQSLKNLIFTDYGERFFQPTIGSFVNRVLFEPNDIIAQTDLKYYITTTITQNEPRINLIGITINPNIDQNSVAVNIVFSIINTTTIQTINLILQRVR